MNQLNTPAANAARLYLRARTAADLMTTNPLSIRDSATVQEAVVFLTDKGFTAAPVIDRAGRPVGVLSQADLVIRDREKVAYLAAARNCPDSPEAIARAAQRMELDAVPIREVMTPNVFTVGQDVPAGEVVDQLLDLRVHRLFVIDRAGVLVGTISMVDVLRHLRPELQGTG